MDPYIIWTILGILLVIIELATGTLYLLFLGVAALVAAGIAFAGGGVPIQIVSAGVVAIAALFYVQNHKRTRTQPRMASLDAGQPVTFEDWIDRGARRARVRYRGTTWEATIAGDATAASGETFYIVSVDANMLTITKQH